jgi:hypothetical protein
MKENSHEIEKIDESIKLNKIQQDHLLEETKGQRKYLLEKTASMEKQKAALTLQAVDQKTRIDEIEKDIQATEVSINEVKSIIAKNVRIKDASEQVGAWLAKAATATQEFSVT